MSIKLTLCSYNPVYAHFIVLKMKGFAMKNSKSAVFRRQQELLSLLKREKSIDVDTAAQELNVSPTTVRRDLNVFEKQHLVERFHGGARLLEGTLKELAGYGDMKPFECIGTIEEVKLALSVSITKRPEPLPLLLEIASHFELPSHEILHSFVKNLNPDHFLNPEELSLLKQAIYELGKAEEPARK